MAVSSNETVEIERPMRIDIEMAEQEEPIYEQIDTSSRREPVFERIDTSSRRISAVPEMRDVSSVLPVIAAGVKNVARTESVLVYNPAMVYHGLQVLECHLCGKNFTYKHRADHVGKTMCVKRA